MEVGLNRGVEEEEMWYLMVVEGIEKEREMFVRGRLSRLK